MRGWCILIVMLAACQKQEAEKPQFQASCKHDATFDNIDCVVENIGKRRGRACVTARVQVPKSRPLIAQRVCTKPLDPGQRLSFRPKFERTTDGLQKICAPDGQWVCRDEIVETPEMLTENIPEDR